MKKLLTIQSELKAPKNLYNSFGKYKFRNAEGILTAVKPYLKDLNCTLKLDDEVVLIGNRYYVKATATLKDLESGETESASASAREPETKKGMDESQITGTASSYARKYALNGLFLLDDTKDADSTNKHGQDEKSKYKGKANYQYMSILELINGTPIKFSQVQAWIKKEFASAIHPNDLNEEQYETLYKALESKIDELMK